MKRFLLSFLFLLFVLCAEAQHWLKEGATYNYHYTMHPNEGYRQLIYEKDTIFEGKNCCKLNLYEQNCSISNNCYPSNYVRDFFIHKRNDSVFILSLGVERFLFDLNPSVGDIWNYGSTPAINYGYECNALNRTQVDSIRVDTINGFPIKKIFIHAFEGSFYGYRGYITDRYGPASSFFDWSYSRFCRNSNMISPHFEQLTCYTDSLYPMNGTYCESPFVSPIGLNEYNNDVAKIFPNPAGNYVYVKLKNTYPNSVFTMKLFNIAGQLVKQESYTDLKRTIEFSVEELKKGIYIIEIESLFGKERAKIIKE